uniref:LysM domain-containing protein n=1 Tax=Sinocyclocheilus rhinocerous TaxID=307959 RepID=A0A673FNU0_9TELE
MYYLHFIQCFSQQVVIAVISVCVFNECFESLLSDEISKSCGQTKKARSKPPGTVEFTVGAKDTLNSIALKFNITPNKLVQLNRLYSLSVVPGQVRLLSSEGKTLQTACCSL